MWQYNNVRFIYNNDVDSIHGNTQTIPFLRIYVKSKFALMQALRIHVENSYLGPYTEIDPRTVKYDPPVKI
jgi:hypothetical protein